MPEPWKTSLVGTFIASGQNCFSPGTKRLVEHHKCVGKMVRGSSRWLSSGAKTGYMTPNSSERVYIDDREHSTESNCVSDLAPTCNTRSDRVRVPRLSRGDLVDCRPQSPIGAWVLFMVCQPRWSPYDPVIPLLSWPCQEHDPASSHSRTNISPRRNLKCARK
jgi:hypothetical protein